MNRIRVYVAGPYTKPDPCINVNKAIYVGNELWELGFAPFIPHLTHLWHTVTPQPYEMWCELDNQFLPCCEVVLRIPGESSGADAEVKLAESLSIPVFYSIDDLKHFQLTKNGWYSS